MRQVPLRRVGTEGFPLACCCIARLSLPKGKASHCGEVFMSLWKGVPWRLTSLNMICYQKPAGAHTYPACAKANQPRVE
jgi:hypothetical protein